MKKVLFSIAAIVTMSLSAMAAEDVVPVDSKSENINMFRCCGTMGVFKNGVKIGGGTYTSDLSGTDCTSAILSWAAQRFVRVYNGVENGYTYSTSGC